MTVDQVGGFTRIPFNAGGAIDSMFGVGAQTGYEKVVQCPTGTVVTGIAGGANPKRAPSSWLSHFQIQCRWGASWEAVGLEVVPCVAVNMLCALH